MLLESTGRQRSCVSTREELRKESAVFVLRDLPIWHLCWNTPKEWSHTFFPSPWVYIGAKCLPPPSRGFPISPTHTPPGPLQSSPPQLGNFTDVCLYPRHAYKELWAPIIVPPVPRATGCSGAMPGLALDLRFLLFFKRLDETVSTLKLGLNIGMPRCLNPRPMVSVVIHLVGRPLGGVTYGSQRTSSRVTTNPLPRRSAISEA